MDGEVAGDGDLDFAEPTVGDFLARLGRGGQNLAHSAALVGGDDHHGAPVAANLLIGPPDRRCHRHEEPSARSKLARSRLLR